MKKKIFTILPFKESLNPNIAGAVSIYVKDTLKYSKYKKYIKVISSDNMKSDIIFRNKSYINSFCEKHKNLNIDLIEIHNRPEYISYIKKSFPNSKINITFHNDPISLRGSQTLKQREFLVKNCHKVIFISRWIQQRFFTNFINSNYLNTEIIYHGVNKEKKINLKNKKKNILFVGKLNKAKGYEIFVNAAIKFKKYDKSWNFIAIGDEPRKDIFPDKNVINEIGYKTNREVLNFYKKSSIAVGNSVWNEPLGRIAIEASSRKCLPIISDVAGLQESKNIAYVLKKNNSDELFKSLKKITSDDKLRKSLQIKYYNNNEFNLKNISKSIDNIRQNLLENKSIQKQKKILKVLHIANFNEMADGRLYYAFANKLNNGFIKNDHIVYTISDRMYLKTNKSFLNPHGNIYNLNKKILNTLKNFSPDALIIGHVFKISDEIFDFCKKNNIKTASWFIDSISNEFFHGDKKKDFISMLNKVDRSFITSSPKKLKNLKNSKKIKFIPNPVDKSIDHFSNYNNKNLEYDLFFAISHGQNRAVLKKGKSDERETMLSYTLKKLNKYKIAFFGLNDVEPVWGSNYYYYLSRSKIALNISRGAYQDLYSSDRISSLMGNGLLVFISSNTKLQSFFKDKKEAVYYKNKKDLVEKIKYYLKNNKIRENIAKKGHIKYHKYFNNKITSNYILSELNLIKKNKIIWVKD